MAPVRTCIGCRRRAGLDQLVRVIRRSDGTLEVGRTLPGRGAWLCSASPACVDAAERRRAFDRALRGPVAPDAVAVLREAQACARMRRSSEEDIEG
ncbi:MAG: YlxR family protein [Actinobacteria bacterium]|nr:YlxR family protein [Actinomycetota bacterium]MBW3643151.1 YlxR family protein [Actinomycetota bacterium]